MCMNSLQACRTVIDGGGDGFVLIESLGQRQAI